MTYICKTYCSFLIVVTIILHLRHPFQSAQSSKIVTIPNKQIRLIIGNIGYPLYKNITGYFGGFIGWPNSIWLPILVGDAEIERSMKTGSAIHHRIEINFSIQTGKEPDSRPSRTYNEVVTGNGMDRLIHPWVGIHIEIFR